MSAKDTEKKITKALNEIDRNYTQATTTRDIFATLAKAEREWAEKYRQPDTTDDNPIAPKVNAFRSGMFDAFDLRAIQYSKIVSEMNVTIAKIEADYRRIKDTANQFIKDLTRQKIAG